LLVDCHSMPVAAAGTEIVLGDRFGRSAAPWVVAKAARIAEEAGFSVAVNDPFAGGHVLDRHGAPHLGIHAIQIEIDRGLYLTRAGEPGPSLDRVATLIEAIALGLGEQLLGHSLADAAE
jgi:N-formylglutamate amidohydrolase